MKWKTYLSLGRVSNLPTVVSNALAGAVLGGALDGRSVTSPAAIVLLVASLALFYVGGMFLNDAFDRHIDAKVHPQRPIPSGRIGAREVFAMGFALLAFGEAGITFTAHSLGQPVIPTALTGLFLGGLIVLYDAWHKNNPIGPLLMGGCRMLVYWCAGLATSGSLGAPVVYGSLVLLSYLIGLTYVAKQETLARFQNFWPLLFLLAPFVCAPFMMCARAANEGAGASMNALTAGARATVTVGAPWLFWAVHLGLLAWVASAVVLLKKRAPGNIPRAVIRLIAGISLVDALSMFGAASVWVVTLAVACFFATLFLQRYVRGT